MTQELLLEKDINNIFTIVRNDHNNNYEYRIKKLMQKINTNPEYIKIIKNVVINKNNNMSELINQYLSNLIIYDEEQFMYDIYNKDI